MSGASQSSSLQSSAGNRAVIRVLTTQLPVQRFNADEHEWLGNAGSSGLTVPLGGGYTLTFGEMVAMAGDHFATIDQMRAFARNKAPGPGGVDELEYVRRVDIHGEDTPDEFKELTSDEQIALTYGSTDPAMDRATLRRRMKGAAAATAAEKRYYALAGRNQSHFLQPKGRRSPLADPTHALAMAELMAVAGVTPAQVLEGSAANYRNYHVRAIKEAVLAGQTGGEVMPALAVEAFGAHYLTDSFAGGHVETERTSINEHWNSRVPMFPENLVGYISETMAKAVAATMTLGPFQLRPDVAYHFGARDAVEGALASKGTFQFGDVVSGAVHDVANEQGQKAYIETGFSTELVDLRGDGHLGEGDEKEYARQAVMRGVNEVGKAYELARKSPSPSVASVIAALAPDGTFSPEQLLPQSVPSSEPPMWEHDTVDELFKDPRMQEAMTLFGEEKANELATAAAALDDETQKRLFKQHVVEPFRSDPIGLMRQVLAWTPDTGGGALGHNTDDNALDYVNAARDSGGMGSLSYDQRRRLIDNLLEGATVGDDEDAIVDLLTTASNSDARALITHFGWGRLHDDIDDFVGNDFANKFPKADYGS